MSGTYRSRRPFRVACSECAVAAEFRSVSDIGDGWTFKMLDGRPQWRCPSHQETLAEKAERIAAWFYGDCHGAVR